MTAKSSPTHPAPGRRVASKAAFELLTLPLGQPLAEAPSPTRTRTDIAQTRLAPCLDNEQMSINRTAQPQRPRLTCMVSVVSRFVSSTNQLLRRNFTFPSWPATHQVVPKSRRSKLTLVSTRVRQAIVHLTGHKGLHHKRNFKNRITCRDTTCAFCWMSSQDA